jgi:peptidoglycan/xylan/chitin deacetylase (PgdA/CDA1 family)
MTRRTTRRAAWTLALITALVATLAGLRGLARARTFQLFGTLVARVPTAAPRVALTFDDGPTPAPLDTLLAVLGARGVRATFFVTGRELAATPEGGARLVAAGHELGNHSWSHRRMVLIGPGTIRAEVERTDSLVRRAGHEGPIFFRPPYGYKLAGLPWYLSRTGRTTVTWDVEPDSYADVAASAEGIVRHVLERVRPGSIILLHPWYPSRATSLAAVGPMVDSLRSRGFEVVPVGELMR